MDLALGSTAPPQDVELRAAAFEFGIEPALLVDPHADLILDANPAACTLLGYDRALLRQTKVSTLHAGQLPALIVFTQAVLDKGAFWTNALTPRHTTGQTLRLEYAGSLVPGDGRALVLLTLSDLDARRRRYVDAAAEDHMRSGIATWQRVERVFEEIERENQLILRAAGEGIYGVNADGKTTFVNPAAERMLGWTAEELVGKEIHPIVHHTHHDGRHYPDHDCPIYAAFRDGAVHQVDGEVFWRKDGTPVWVEYTSTPIRDRGVVVGAVIVFRDVGQRREADEKLHAALAEVDRLRERLELENAYLQEEIRIETNPRGIIGQSEAIQTTLRQVELVAPTSAAVLITGESGTGKELIARAIHEAQQPPRPAADPRQLRGDPARTVRERVLRPRPRRLHRRDARPHRAVRARRRRHAVSRRGRRNSARAARQAVARAAGGQVRTRRRRAHPRGRRAPDRRHQPRPEAGGAARTVPRGPLFPAQRVSDGVVPLRERREDIPLLGAALPQQREQGAEIASCDCRKAMRAGFRATTGPATSANCRT